MLSQSIRLARIIPYIAHRRGLEKSVQTHSHSTQQAQSYNTHKAQHITANNKKNKKTLDISIYVWYNRIGALPPTTTKRSPNYWLQNGYKKCAKL